MKSDKRESRNLLRLAQVAILLEGSLRLESRKQSPLQVVSDKRVIRERERLNDSNRSAETNPRRSRIFASDCWKLHEFAGIECELSVTWRSKLVSSSVELFVC